jgi:phosphatidate cytidylyltransferase
LLRSRLISACILIVSVLVVVYLDARYPLFQSPGLWLVPVLFFFVLGTAWEFAKLANREVSTSKWLPVALAAVSLLISSLPIWVVAATRKTYSNDCPVGVPGWIGLGLVAVCGLAGIATLRSYSKGESQTLERWAILTLIPTYAAGLGSFWVPIRLYGEPFHALLNLCGIIAVTKITDAAAYFTGRAFGKNKLWPSISPGKTWEGAMGGLFGATVTSIVYFQFIVPIVLKPASVAGPIWWGPALLGLLIGLVAMIGDLIESMVKRAVKEKDSSQLLPGLGGIWDVTDSLLPTAAVGYLGLIAKWI